jgi:polyisoprenoid-binding protein YceI
MPESYHCLIADISGTRTLGPSDARLTVNTGKTGAASKAGHNLLIEVSSWSATLVLGENDAGSSLNLTADSRSLRVLDGTGGMQSLGDDDKANISQTIDDEVLKGGTIEYRSQAVHTNGERLTVEGELELLGTRRPLAFELEIAEDGKLSGEARFKQSDWGMKPYSALFGTLKVTDEITVAIDGRLPAV